MEAKGVDSSLSRVFNFHSFFKLYCWDDEEFVFEAAYLMFTKKWQIGNENVEINFVFILKKNCLFDLMLTISYMPTFPFITCIVA